jgi:uncharacterized protein
MWRAAIKLESDSQALRGVLVAVLVCFVLVLSAGGAQALDLQTAKAQGLVGEQSDGYLGIPNPPGSADVQKLVADINLKRRELYQKSAAALSPPVSLEQYEVIIGAKLISEAKPGEYVRGADGAWKRK